MPIGDGGGLGGLGLSVGLSLNITGFEQLAGITQQLEALQAMALKTQTAFEQMGAAFAKSMSTGGLEATRARGEMERLSRTTQSQSSVGAGSRTTTMGGPQYVTGVNPISSELNKSIATENGLRKQHAAVIEEEMAARKQLFGNISSGIMGGIGIAAAFEGVNLIRTGMKAAGQLDERLASMRITGHSADEIQRSLDASYQAPVHGVNVAERMFLQQEMSGILGKEVSAETVKGVSVLARAVTRLTGQGDIQSNTREILRSADSLGNVTGPSGKLDEGLEMKNAMAVEHMLAATQGFVSAETMMHNARMATVPLQALDIANSPHAQAQFAVMNEELGQRAGDTLNNMFTQSIAGITLGSKKASLLQEHGLLDMGKVEPLLKMPGGGASLIGFDMLAGQGNFLDKLQHAHQVLTEDAKRQLPNDVNAQRNLVFGEEKSIFGERAARGMADLDTPTGLEKIAKTEERIRRLGTSIEEIDQESQNFNDGLQAVKTSFEDLFTTLTHVGGVTDMLYGLSNALSSTAGFLHTHDDITKSLVGIGEGIAAFAGILAVAKVGSMGGKMLSGIFAGAAEGEAVTGLASVIGLAVPEIAALVGAAIIAKEGLTAVGEWFTHWVSGRTDDQEKERQRFLGEKKKELDAESDAQGGMLPAQRRREWERLKNLPDFNSADQKEEDAREGSRSKFMQSIAAPPAPATTPTTPGAHPAPNYTVSRAGQQGVPGNAPYIPLPNVGPTTTQRPSDLRAIQQGMIHQTPPVGGSLPPSTPSFASPSGMPRVAGAATATMPQMGSLSVNTIHAGSLIVGSTTTQGSHGAAPAVGAAGGAGTPGGTGAAGPMGNLGLVKNPDGSVGTPGGGGLGRTTAPSSSSGAAAGPGATGVGGPGGVMPAPQSGLAGQWDRQTARRNQTIQDIKNGGAPVTQINPDGSKTTLYPGTPQYEAARKATFGLTQGQGRGLPASLAGSSAVAAPLSSAQQKAVASDSVKFWMGKGLNKAQASGMAAQEIRESGGNPRAIGDGGLAHGLYQEHPDRIAAIKAATGIDMMTADAQHQREGAYWEMTHTEKNAWNQINAATTAQQAGAAGSMFFERPADKMGEASTRGALAGRIYNDVPNVQGPRVTAEQADVPASQTLINLHSHTHLDGDEIGNAMATHIIGGGPTSAAGISGYDTKAMPYVPGTSPISIS